jgi:hypothetical protein
MIHGWKSCFMNHFMLSLMLLAPYVDASAEVVDIAWDAQGRFVHEAPVEPGKFAEICGKLKKGEAIAWRYDGSAALDFNIHYHVDKTVIYPVRKPTAKAARGQLRAALDQDYCWMWTNKGAQAVVLKVALRREG